LSDDELIYDWNQEVPASVSIDHDRRIELNDETLRDGLQSPSVTDPPIEKKIEILDLMVELGIDAADIGLPAAGPAVQKQVEALACHIAHNKLPIRPNCAGRTLPADVDPIIAASQKSGIALDAALFLGCSPIRGLVEGWSVEKMGEIAEKAIRYARDNGLPVMFVTEDTTRSSPDVLRHLYTTAIEAGAERICAADTTGHATPSGTRRLVSFLRKLVDDSAPNIQIDWHGHNDRGLGLVNAVFAIEAGADRVHATALGVGERCGNTSMEILLANLHLSRTSTRSLVSLMKYCRLVAEALEVPIPVNHPVVGRDAFRTATGVHAAAVLKAMRQENGELADQIYSSIPASLVGRRQRIEVGPMSGASNVQYWLMENGYAPNDFLIKCVLDEAKRSKRALSDEQLKTIVKSVETAGR
jgi:2-isopropylmalate synthase